jgi:hypothetical protein
MYSHTKHRLNKAILTEKGIATGFVLIILKTPNSKQPNLVQPVFFNEIIKTNRRISATA